MAVVDVSEELKSLSSTMESIEAVLDLDSMRADIAVLEEQAAAPSLWDDPEAAQKITSKLSHLQAEVRKAEALRGRIDDLSVLFEMAEEEDDPDTRAEAESELTAVKKALDEMEVRTLLSGEYDSREAVVTIRAEAGGVDASDFAEKLQRMYLRWAERHGYKTELYETSYAEEAGIKSTTFAVNVPYAYGTLSVEHGARTASCASAPLRQPGPPPDLVRRRRDPPPWSSRPTTSRSTRAATLLGPRRQGVNTSDSGAGCAPPTGFAYGHAHRPPATRGASVIRFDNVSKAYPKQTRPALRDVSLEIEKGEFVFLVGSSGSGKSTFLRLVLREERTSHGQVHVLGKDLARLSNFKVPHMRRQLGTVFQDFRLLPNKTVGENVAFAQEVIGKSRGEIRKSVPRSSTSWDSAARRTGCPASSPEVSSNEWRSRARSSTVRSCSSPTSRPATSTRRPPSAS
ncbi:Peptide chain release factor 2 [Streptomyces alboniger]